jgi:hypothetical protein
VPVIPALPTDIETSQWALTERPAGADVDADTVQRLWATDRANFAKLRSEFARLRCQYQKVRREVGRVASQAICRARG